MTALKDASRTFLRIATEILMGAAFSDGVFEETEEDALIDLLLEAIDADELPDELYTAMEEFDPDDFDLEATAEPLADEPYEHRNYLMSMVFKVRAVDPNDDPLGGELEEEDPEDGINNEVEDDFRYRLAEALDIDLDLLNDGSPLD